jgi:predicted DNA-binding transcriptional regulator YafY
MSKREFLSRYNLIINKLRKKPATFKEINDFLERESEIQEYKFTVSSRTFKRDLDDIRSLFNINIEYDFSKKVYFINDEGQLEVNDRMLEAFDTFQVLNISNGLSNYIHLEKRKPQGTENLYGLLHSIKNSLIIKFDYQKFWDSEATLRKAEPYALKEFKNRWYVLAKDFRDEQIKSFALDRLTNLEITSKKFKYPPNYNVEEHYKYCFGIISPNGQEPEEVILSFNTHQGKYLKTLPLHHTQEVILDTDDELQIKLKICVTHDFLMELLSFGDQVQILKPLGLVNEIKRIYTQSLNRYV